MDAKIEISKSGAKVLIVPYSGDHYNKAIKDAERRFNPKRELIQVIAIPVKLCHTVFLNDCNN